MTFVDGSRLVVEVKAEKFAELSKTLIKEAAEKLRMHQLEIIVATDVMLRKSSLSERALLIRRYSKSAFILDEWRLAESLFKENDSGLPIGFLRKAGISLPTLLHAVCHRKLQISSDLRFDDSDVLQMSCNNFEGVGHAIRFASWLNA